MKSLILQHRHELLHQNRQKLTWLHPELTTSVFNAKDKDFTGDVVFASVQSLERYKGPYPHFDIIATDEAHHSIAPTYQKILKGVLASNPCVKHLGVTATPNRGDKKGLVKVYDNVADQIFLEELIVDNHLVEPRTFVLDLGCKKELEAIYKKYHNKAESHALDEAALVLNNQSYNEEVVRLWQEHAGGRKTVLFAARVDHAKAMQEVFEEKGIECLHVNGDMSLKEREKVIQDFAKGPSKIITNVAVLTEGWDCPEVSCVILLRPASYKSTMIQMVGRGLRSHPDKTDCIILDFGLSSKKHGKLEQDINLDPAKGKAPTKDCPGCSKPLPLSARICEYCGFKYEDDEDDEEKSNKIKDPNFPKLTMKELTLVDTSHYRWEMLEGHEDAYGAMQYGTVYITKIKDKRYALFFQEYSPRYPNREPIEIIRQGTKASCFNRAEKLLNAYNKRGFNVKDNMWSQVPLTKAQAGVLKSLLGRKPKQPCSKYKASLNIGLLCSKTGMRILLRSSETLAV